LWLIKGLGLGGAERLLLHTASEIATDDFEITCVFVDQMHDDLVQDLETVGVRCECVSRFRIDPLWPWRLWSIIRSTRFDVVHSHSPLPASVARLALRLTSKRNRPVHVTTVHALWSSYRPITRWLNAITSPLDDACIVVSEAALETIAGPVRKCAEVQIQGIDLRHLGRLRRLQNERQSSLAQPVRLVTVGSFKAQKDYPTLFRACRIAIDSGVDFQVAVVGSGTAQQRREVIGLCGSLGLTDTIRFVGLRADALEFMADCDAMVIASASEGGPLVAMEAAAIGLPIISTEVGLMEDVFQNGEDCLLVSPQDPAALARAIVAIVNDRELRERLSSRALRTAEQFDRRLVTRRLESLYRSHARRRQGAA